MSHVWPAATRLLCIGPRSVQCAPRIDSLVARLVRTTLRPYSRISTSPRWADDRTRYAFTNQSIRSNPVTLPRSVTNKATTEVITRHQDLPEAYRDEQGLSYQHEPLTKDQVISIFGASIDMGIADRVLRIIHGRRVAGTLEDPSYFPATSRYEDDIKRSALNWLRKEVPMDEDEAAGLRAEEELAEMEEELLADSEKFGIYQPNSGELKGREVYGKGGLDTIREEREARLDKLEQEEAEKLSQAQEIQHNTGTLEPVSVKSRVELRRVGENPKLRYYEERSHILPDQAPELTLRQRLLPTFLVVATVVAFSVVLASVYTPPHHSARLWPEMPPAAATVISIMVANTAIFILWRVPPAWRVLNKYFITAPGYPFAWSALGNVFSHQGYGHFATNMAVLWIMGTALHDELGRAKFLAIYLSSGVVGSFASLTFFTLSKNFITSSLGASGALAGVIAAWACMHQDRPISVFFLPPEWTSWITAYMFLGALVLADLAALFKLRGVGIDAAAHLGGTAAGFVGGEILRRRSNERKTREIERRKDLGTFEKLREDWKR